MSNPLADQPSTEPSNPPAPEPLLWLGRVGFAAKGIVLTTLGLLAVNGAVRVGDRTATLPVEERAAVRVIHHAPLGSWLVGALSAGLLSYAIYQGTRAILDPQHAGAGVGGLIKRGWLLWLGLLNLVLAVSAGALAAGLAKQNRDSPASRVSGAAWNVTDAAAHIASSDLARRAFILFGLAWFLYGTVRAGQAINGRSGRLRGRSSSASAIIMPRWRRRAIRLNLAGRGAVTMGLGVVLVLGGWFDSADDVRRVYHWYESQIHSPVGRPALILSAVILLGWGTFDFLRMLRPIAAAGQTTVARSLLAIAGPSSGHSGGR